MGMDIFGLNPIVVGEEPPYPTETLDVKGFEEYYNTVRLFEKENPGVYFRANCWNWRPILNLIYEVDAFYDLELDPEVLEGMACNMGMGLEDQGDCDKLADAMEDQLQSISEDVISWDCGDPDFSDAYKVSKEHVYAFITFLRNCGGFQVC